MKKKSIYITCGIFITIAIVAMFVFIFGGENTFDSEKIDVEGTWKVATYINSENITLVDDEYMVFDLEKATNYRNGAVYLESRYLMEDNSTIKLKDINCEYRVEKYTDNYIRLYENKNVYMDLIKCFDADLSEKVIDTSIVSGRWNVIYRQTDQVIVDEYLVFEDEVMSDYRNGEVVPVLVSDYSWQYGNHLIAESLGKDMVLNIISDNIIILIETDTGYIMELHKAN